LIFQQHNNVQYRITAESVKGFMRYDHKPICGLTYEALQLLGMATLLLKYIDFSCSVQQYLINGL
jgi:hypothetical protein